MNRKEPILFATDVSRLCDPHLYARAYRLATKERKEKSDNYRMKKDQYLSLGAELLLRYALKKRRILLDDLNIRISEKGKPFLGGLDNLYFNLSHSGDLAICAISSKEIGCDIEQIKEINVESLLRYFAPCEAQKIKIKCTKLKQMQEFFRYWTLKESFLKVTGQGLSLPLDSFYFTEDPEGMKLHQSVSVQEYFVREIPCHVDYKCSICGLDHKIIQETIEMLYEFVDIEDLLNYCE